jgi:hypothetical protein
MAEKFKIEDEHRAGVRTYRLLAGDRIIARDVCAEFVDLLASAGVLKDALYAILYTDQDNLIPDDLHAQAREALDAARALRREVIGFV